MTDQQTKIMDFIILWINLKRLDVGNVGGKTVDRNLAIIEPEYFIRIKKVKMPRVAFKIEFFSLSPIWLYIGVTCGALKIVLLGITQAYGQ